MKQLKVKIISNFFSDDLEKSVNYFIKNKDVKAISFTASVATNSMNIYKAFIQYYQEIEN